MKSSGNESLNFDKKELRFQFTAYINKRYKNDKDRVRKLSVHTSNTG